MSRASGDLKRLEDHISPWPGARHGRHLSVLPWLRGGGHRNVDVPMGSDLERRPAQLWKRWKLALTYTHTFTMITTLSKIHFHPTSKPAHTAYWSRAMLCSTTRWAFEFHLRGEFRKCLFASVPFKDRRGVKDGFVGNHSLFFRGRLQGWSRCCFHFTVSVRLLSNDSFANMISLILEEFFFLCAPPGEILLTFWECFINKFQILSAFSLSFHRQVKPLRCLLTI